MDWHRYRMTFGVAVGPVDTIGIAISAVRTLLLQALMCATSGRAIVGRRTDRNLGPHAVGTLQILILGHTIVGTVKSHVGDAVISINAGGHLEPLGEVVADLAEDGDLALEDLLVGADGHLTSHVVDEALAGTVVEDLFPQGAGGVKIFGSDLRQEADGVADKVAVRLVQVDGTLAEPDGLDGAEVVGPGALVVEGHLAVPLEVGRDVARAWSVHRQLLIVDANAVAVSVRIGKEARLEDGVGGWLDAGGHVGRVECDLLHLGKVISRILVENHLADLATGELLLGPDVGQVEDIDLLVLPKLFGLLRGHGLDLDGPAGIVTPLNGFVQVLLRIVGRILGRLLLSDILDPLHGLHVELAVDPVVVLVDELDSVTEVAVHETIAIGDASVAHQNHDLMDGLGVLGEVVPEGGTIIGMGEMSGRIALLGVDEMGKLGWVSEEEDRGVVGDDIPITLGGSHLDREASWIAGEIGGAGFATDGRKTNGDGTFLVLGAEDVGRSQVIERIGADKFAMSTTALGMDYSLGDSFAVEMGEQVYEVARG